MYLHSEIPPFFAICNLLASILSFSIIFKREKHIKYLQTVVTQYFANNKSEIWS